MPKYFYKCSACKEQISAFHSMTEKMHDCTKCEAKNTLQRLPSSFVLHKEEGSTEVGSLVRETISEIQEDISQQKEKIKSDLYEPNK